MMRILSGMCGAVDFYLGATQYLGECGSFRLAGEYLDLCHGVGEWQQGQAEEGEFE